MGTVAPAMYVHPSNVPGSCYCGVPNAMNGHRIVGGEEVQIGEYPWQVALLFGNSVQNQGCGGSLVSDQYVITAAHCTDGASASSIKVLVGDTSLALTNEATSFIIAVSSIIQHPS